MPYPHAQDFLVIIILRFVVRCPDRMLRRPEGDLKPCLWPRCVGYMVPRLRIFVLGRSRIVVRAVISSFWELSLLSLKLRGNHCAGVTYGRAKVKVWNCEIVKAVPTGMFVKQSFGSSVLLCFFPVYDFPAGDRWWLRRQGAVQFEHAQCPVFCVEFGTSEGFKPIPACGAAESFQQDFPVSKLAFTNWLCLKIRKCQHRIKKMWNGFVFCLGGGYKTPKLWFGIFVNEPSQIINHLDDVFNHPK